MTIKLSEFRIRNFRCIDDSDWIKVEDITAMVGVNEAGKTALLQALLTLNPGSGELDIDYIRDFPRERLTEDYSEDCILAEGHYYIPKGYLNTKLNINELNLNPDNEIILTLTRKYDKKLYYNFNIELGEKFIPQLKKALQEARKKLSRKKVNQIPPISEIPQEEQNKDVQTEETKEDQIGTFTEEIKSNLVEFINLYLKEIEISYNENYIFNTPEKREEITQKINQYNQVLGEHFQTAEDELRDLLDYFEEFLNNLQGKSLSEKLYDLVKMDLPVYIYFEDYNILDGSIIISDLVMAIQGDLKFKGFKIQETLFKHVNLDPIEIYNLGSTKLTDTQKGELNSRIQQKNINADQITKDFYEKVSKEKQQELKKRKILLDSASQLMTKTLNKYFQERNYKVEYDTDGQFFQILIWDEKRPSKINLEERSKGFRWYFSFFLVFLVESEGMHKNAILLLDEPGIHLHLQAQFNLINFFQKLEESNQIIYTTHSPFLIDENHLEQVRSVYEDKDGITHITDNNLIPDKKSIFPLQAALSYKTSQVIYQGLKQLLVEGDGDYNYIKSINYILDKAEKESLDKDIVIIPCKSASKVDMYARLFIDLENVPVVLLDSDAEGRRVFDTLTEKLFSKNKKNVLKIGDFLKKGYDTEIEDFIGRELIVDCINKNNITKAPVSLDEIEDGTFIDKLVDYCQKNKISFNDKLNWKYEISLKFKNSILSEESQDIINKIKPEKLSDFENLINKINQYAKKKVN